MSEKVEIPQIVADAAKEKFSWTKSLDEAVLEALANELNLCRKCKRGLGSSDTLYCWDCSHPSTCKLCGERVYSIDKFSICDACSKRPPIPAREIRIQCGNCRIARSLDQECSWKIFRRGAGWHDSWAEFLGLLGTYNCLCPCGATNIVKVRIPLVLRDWDGFEKQIGKVEWFGENCSVLEAPKIDGETLYKDYETIIKETHNPHKSGPIHWYDPVPVSSTIPPEKMGRTRSCFSNSDYEEYEIK